MAILTNEYVAGLPPADTGKEYAVWCDDLPGFGVRVRDTGNKSFCVMYREGGREATAKRVTLGNAKTVSADAARQKAIEYKQNAALRASMPDVQDFEIPLTNPNEADQAKALRLEAYTRDNISKADNKAYALGFNAGIMAYRKMLGMG